MSANDRPDDLAGGTMELDVLPTREDLQDAEGGPLPEMSLHTQKARERGSACRKTFRSVRQART
jgi:hypothetical protein